MVANHFTPAWRLRRAVRCLRRGGVIAYPTETVYGLGCHPLDAEAVERLLILKDRPADKGLILIAHAVEVLAPWLAIDPATLARLATPGERPVSWVVPAASWVPEWLSGGRRTLAVRITSHPLARVLCAAFGGPLISTSANRSGHPPARTALEVRLRLGDEVDYLLHGQAGPHRRPSQIRDALSNRLIRP